MLVALVLLMFGGSFGKSTFKENLDLRPLNNGLLLAQFQFEQSIIVPTNPHGELDYGSFPGAMEELVRDFDLEELRLSFGRGRWDQQIWGQAPFHLASTGIQLHSWFKTGTISVQSRWARLTHTLSGLLCGSIGLMNDAKTSVPIMTFERSSPGDCDAELRFGVLPREAVCTENLTPWVKMLPCMSNAGIGMLLNPVKIYDSRFNLMDMWLTTNSTPNGKMITLKQNLYVVYDLARWNSDVYWSFSMLFERRIGKVCPAANGDTRINVHYEDKIGSLHEEATETLDTEDEGKKDPRRVAVYSASQNILHRDIGVEYKDKSIPSGRLDPSEVHIVRFITGSGQERGSVLSQISNTSSRQIEVTVLETLPWSMRLYMHTMKVHLNGNPTELGSLLYSPSIDRVKPSQVEWKYVIPAGSRLTVETDFDMALLRYSEYPLDPARGFDVNGAIVKFKSHDSSLTHQIVSHTILLTLPTPDFTMPFNVIMLTSLALTFFYGYFFNLAFRRFYLHDPKSPHGLLGKIQLFVRSRILKQKLD